MVASVVCLRACPVGERREGEVEDVGCHIVQITVNLSIGMYELSMICRRMKAMN